MAPFRGEKVRAWDTTYCKRQETELQLKREERAERERNLKFTEKS